MNPNISLATGDYLNNKVKWPWQSYDIEWNHDQKWPHEGFLNRFERMIYIYIYHFSLVGVV